MDCIFCKIASKEIPSKIVFENERIIAFEDINPKAPTHILIIPKKHIPYIAEIKKEDIPLVGELIYVARKIAEEKELDKDGYRLVFNNGKNAGQEVFHIHLHLLGGRKFGWPPG